MRSKRSKKWSLNKLARLTSRLMQVQSSADMEMIRRQIRKITNHQEKTMSTPQGDARVVTTDALETLGTIHNIPQHRDAIHLAVEPVAAGVDLMPGQHIVVDNGVAWPTSIGQGLGIVDPFLKSPIQRGDRFWFVMYPRQVHSLRHVWTHPAFPDA